MTVVTLMAERRGTIHPRFIHKRPIISALTAWGSAQVSLSLYPLYPSATRGMIILVDKACRSTHVSLSSDLYGRIIQGGCVPFLESSRNLCYCHHPRLANYPIWSASLTMINGKNVIMLLYMKRCTTELPHMYRQI